MSIDSLADLELWRAGHEYPWVLKGDGTFGGRGVRIASNFAHAKEYYAELTGMFGFARALKRAIVNRDPFWLRPWWNNHSPTISVQSHIIGHPANCAVLCWKGEVLAFISVEVVSSDGLTGPASIVRIVESTDMAKAAERIARRLGMSGFFGLDFMIEAGSHRAYLIEMNPRPTPLTHLQLGKRRDLIEALAARLYSRPIRELSPVTTKELVAYFPQAWNSKSEYFSSSFQDIPEGAPDLVKALLEPWPDRSLLFRLVKAVSGNSTTLAEHDSAARELPNVPTGVS